MYFLTTLHYVGDKQVTHTHTHTLTHRYVQYKPSHYLLMLYDRLPYRCYTTTTSTIIIIIKTRLQETRLYFRLPHAKVIETFRFAKSSIASIRFSKSISNTIFVLFNQVSFIIHLFTSYL